LFSFSAAKFDDFKFDDFKSITLAVECTFMLAFISSMSFREYQSKENLFQSSQVDVPELHYSTAFSAELISPRPSSFDSLFYFDHQDIEPLPTLTSPEPAEQGVINRSQEKEIIR
jgi:hypothetical protein